MHDRKLYCDDDDDAVRTCAAQNGNVAKPTTVLDDQDLNDTILTPMSPVKLPLDDEAGETVVDLDVSARPSPEVHLEKPRPLAFEEPVARAYSAPPNLDVAPEVSAPNLGLTFEKLVSSIRAFVSRNAWPAARFVAYGFVGWFGCMVALIVIFGFANPPGSALMAIRSAQGQTIKQSWVDIDSISPNLVRAVIASEDGRFCKHWGVDPREVLQAIKRARNGRPRGASTITMQLAKNMFLWPSPSYVRKVLEVPLTFALELFWSKRRIMEVYLNVVELGPGVFGAKAAAREHFKTSAKSLTASQSALLAVSLPAPLRRKARSPSRSMRRMAGVVVARMRHNRATSHCVLAQGG